MWVTEVKLQQDKAVWIAEVKLQQSKGFGSLTNAGRLVKERNPGGGVQEGEVGITEPVNDLRSNIDNVYLVYMLHLNLPFRPIKIGRLRSGVIH